MDKIIRLLILDILHSQRHPHLLADLIKAVTANGFTAEQAREVIHRMSTPSYDYSTMPPQLKKGVLRVIVTGGVCYVEVHG